jgi:conjugative relaxase-like TrwC/TraI family protein
VLGIHRVGARGADYFLSDLARELPPSADAVAVWTGMAAEGLGLQGPLEAQHLRAVLNGEHPTTGRRLPSTRPTVAGIDLTFTAPKSVSVLFALGGEDVARRVLQAHGEGVRGAVGYVERHALSARRLSGEERHVVPTTGAIAAAFIHGVSRNGDPHLHTHVVLANLVHGADGRWSACDQRGLWAHRAATSAVYDATVRSALTRDVGLEWSAGPGTRFEVRGVSPYLLGEFSSRSADIRRHMAAWGAHSARGAHVAWAVTRSPKETSLEFDRLAEQWAHRGRAVEGGSITLDSVYARNVSVPTTLNEHRFAGILAGSPDGAARRRDVVAAFATAAPGGADAVALDRLTDLWVPHPDGPEELGVAERAHPLRSLVPGPSHLRALGPRPLELSAHEVWREAAQTMNAYRSRWGDGDNGAIPGLPVATPALSALSTDHLVEYLRTANQVEMARTRLKWRVPDMMELDRGR